MSEQSLTSLAILKVNWDNKGHDYVQNFVPFVAESLRRAAQDHVSVAELQSIIRDEFGIVIPQGALNTLLHRAQRQGLVRRTAGVYMRNASVIDPNFQQTLAQVNRQREALITKLISFAETRHSVKWTKDQADEALRYYLQSSCIPILAAAVDGCPIPTSRQRIMHADFIVNAFIIDINERDPDSFSFLETVVKGNMLATALFLPDISKSNRRFDNLHVYFDTRLLLRALGLEGEGLQTSTVELLQLLYELNADLFCFDITRDEIRGILDAVQHALRDPRHRPRRLYGVHEHLLSIGARASDVEKIIAELERSLKRMHIAVRVKPEHTAESGINENDLEAMIQAELPEQSREARLHDLDCLTAIHRLRKGRPQNEIETCGHIFVTTNYSLAMVAAKFFVVQYGRVTVPTCVIDHTMATLAWVKNPTIVADFSKNRLIASSYAALNPTPDLWRKYYEEIERLKERGDITSEEYQLLRFSTVARNALVESTLGSPDAFVGGTVPEILEAAKAHTRKETEEKLAEEQKKREAAEQRADDIKREFEAKLQSQRQRARDIGLSIGRGTKWVVYAFVFVVMGWGFYKTLPTASPQLLNEWVQVVAPAAIAIFFVLGLWNIAEGGSVRQISRVAEVWVTRKVEVLLLKLFEV